MIPIHGGLFSKRLSKQLEGNLQSLKFCLQLLMPDTLDSWEFLFLDSPQWQILPSYCMIMMRLNNFPSHYCIHLLHSSFLIPWIYPAVLERYYLFEGHRGIWIHNQHFEFFPGSISVSDFVIPLWGSLDNTR